MTFYPTYFTDQDKQNWDRIMINNEICEWFDLPGNAALTEYLTYSNYPCSPDAVFFGNDQMRTTKLYLLPPSPEGYLRYVSVSNQTGLATGHTVPMDSAEAILFFLVFDSLFGLEAGDFLDYGFFVLYQGEHSGCYKYSRELGKRFTG